MEVLAHRGWWLEPDQKNTRDAFEKALSAGYGIETDVRDCDGVLVVSHDMPHSAANAARQMDLDAFLDLYISFPNRTTLALNVKADGLTGSLQAALNRRNISKYFVFDMSVPDTLAYLKAGVTTYTRRSEFETGSSLDLRAQGLWLDSFEAPYVTVAEIADGIAAGRPVAVVSPELHGKPHTAAWQSWRSYYQQLPAAKQKLIMLCTDFPGEAETYFKT